MNEWTDDCKYVVIELGRNVPVRWAATEEEAINASIDVARKHVGNPKDYAIYELAFHIKRVPATKH